MNSLIYVYLWIIDLFEAWHVGERAEKLFKQVICCTRKVQLVDVFADSFAPIVDRQLAKSVDCRRDCARRNHSAVCVEQVAAHLQQSSQIREVGRSWQDRNR